MFTIGSLFSGIGGLELGLEWAGLGPVLWQVERDEFCQRVLERHWPDAARFDDVCSVGAAQLAPVDVICGGFPCQDISFAGKGAGLAGARSGLWFEFARIVREVGPRFIVVENVAALLSRGLGDVLGTLSALGYDATWDCIPAAAVGAPHRRDRVFLVAYASGVDVRPQQVSWAECIHKAVAGNDGASGDVADARRPLLDAGERGARETWTGTTRVETRPGGRGERVPRRRKDTPGGTWTTEPNVGRVADGVSDRVDRLRSLGNAVVPQCAEVVGHVVRELAGP